jgi:hypothetical protein
MSHHLTSILVRWKFWAVLADNQFCLRQTLVNLCILFYFEVTSKRQQEYHYMQFARSHDQQWCLYHMLDRNESNNNANAEKARRGDWRSRSKSITKSTNGSSWGEWVRTLFSISESDKDNWYSGSWRELWHIMHDRVQTQNLTEFDDDQRDFEQYIASHIRGDLVRLSQWSWLQVMYEVRGQMMLWTGENKSWLTFRGFAIIKDSTICWLQMHMPQRREFGRPKHRCFQTGECQWRSVSIVSTK